MNLLKRLVREEEGQGLVEYGLIIALIAILVIGSCQPGFCGKQYTPFQSVRFLQ
jgi:Flp pilus assembly pilin Flp